VLYDYYTAYRDGEKISEGPLPVPPNVLEVAHEIHWAIEEVLFGEIQ
jgi:hypothetical protein